MQSNNDVDAHRRPVQALWRLLGNVDRTPPVRRPYVSQADLYRQAALQILKAAVA
jgi:hypothetical protein